MEGHEGMEGTEQLKKNEIHEMDTARPADFSFKKLKVLSAFDVEQARSTRIGKIPGKGTKHKFLTKAVWLNNNKLATIEKLDVFLDSILEYPAQLGWLDLSFNHIGIIDSVLMKYSNLKIIYLHGNRLSSMEEIKKLAAFRQLRSLTLHGNPIADKTYYRAYVLSCLPQVSNLDFTPVTKEERYHPLPIPHDEE